MQTILAILGTIGFFSLIGWLIKVAITHKANELSLQKEIDSLKEEKVDLEEEIRDLKGENAKLQGDINQYTHKNKLLSKFQFNKECGIWKHKESSLDYCNKCLIEKGFESPLQKTNRGTWHCSVCNSYYYEPQNPSHDCQGFGETY